MTIKIRTALPQDYTFIRASWFTSYRGSHLKDMPFPIYEAGMPKQISRLLDRSFVLVAAFQDIPDEILGYAVIEKTCVHWVYVKNAYRKQHIAQALLTGLEEYSLKPKTKSAKSMVEKLHLTFNPFGRD